MASQRTSFDKLQRDRAKKAKAAAKREKRLEGADGDPELTETPEVPAGNDIPADEVLKRLEELHARYDAEADRVRGVREVAAPSCWPA